MTSTRKTVGQKNIYMAGVIYGTGCDGESCARGFIVSGVQFRGSDALDEQAARTNLPAEQNTRDERIQSAGRAWGAGEREREAARPLVSPGERAGGCGA